MKNLHYSFAIIITLLFLGQACSSTKTLSTKPETDIQSVSIFQNNKEVLINGEKGKIENKDFAIRFFCKQYNGEKKEFFSARIVAFSEPEELARIHTGMSKSESICFGIGTGMAASKGGAYEELIFNNDACHYLLYEDKTSKRVDLIGREGDHLNLEFWVQTIIKDGKRFAMNELDATTFYLAIFIDRNLDEIIDEGELTKVTLLVE